MSELIGTLHHERIACTDDAHVFMVHNVILDATWCECGRGTLVGSHTEWHERSLWDGYGQGAKITGYDRYTLNNCGCHPDGTSRVIRHDTTRDPANDETSPVQDGLFGGVA